ncbi:MAG: hypothetical protein P1S60_06895 [Anaerolineae bacterium]|nr:hypothetical protein [Anaerolineae bacterium]
MAAYPFGNDPAKIERYQAFWARSPVTRPLAGFSLVGWFPLDDFSITAAWAQQRYLEPDMLSIPDVVEDHVRMIQEGEWMQDDLIRGTGPMQVAVPFLPGIVGAKLRILPDNVLGEARMLSWEDALQVRLDPANAWFRKYLDLAQALVARAGGLFPVSHSAEIGPTDLHAVLRGHHQSIIDLVDDPGRTSALLQHLGHIFREFTETLWQQLPLFHGGYFDAQYSLWAPGPITRLQEDATAVYSPDLYRNLVQPVDRMLARHFAYSFMHLHSTSMFLLDAILEIEELTCLEINHDASGPPLAKMIPFYRSVQEAKRSLVIRGSFEPEELRMLMDTLDSNGLLLLIMVRDKKEIDLARRIVGM